ncbi:MAG: IS3 family transposase [Spirochaetales bacterium]|nr:IS3 family transposase [Spirochaetales bacterium]
MLNVNDVGKATFKKIKTEFVRQYTFDNVDELDDELSNKVQ